MNVAYNADCLEAMRQMEDNAFDLAVVDPPYGGGQEDKPERFTNHGWFDRYKKPERRGGNWAKKYGNSIVDWDVAPCDEYFLELFRVSKNQIIFGGNYFNLPPTRCFVVWDKVIIPEKFSMSMAEYAWTSFTSNAKIYRQVPNNQYGRFHPAQKPVELYAWIYSNYAKPGYKILDTHLGSGSSRIAAYEAGLDFVGYEIDPEYFRKEEERFAQHTAQLNLFTEVEI